ncbi:hypothetical protein K435DRAFT_793552 [Dendrothele bispora CBS 962.96]|uniref:Uncharacterized protein n=1 Tax=Dendrothele bispora (strain CBS 962.96) TaxID=1314807 RepID=A0A4S8MF36_DENBC|nr:hypothetical protein K435DRAFT_793552 [Dendrothele bispora CBS 962.96]
MPLPQTQSSFPLSDSDILVVKEWVFNTALVSLLLGVQMTLSIVVLCVFILRAQGISLSKARVALSFVTIMMFLASLASLVMSIEDIIIQMPLVGYNPPDLGQINSLNKRLMIGLNVMSRVNYVMGDIVVVWRAWVLFSQRLPAKITLSICLMGSFAGASLDCGLLVKRVMKNHFDTGSKIDSIILAVPLIFTNLTATTLIAFKAWLIGQICYLVLGSTQGHDTTAVQAYNSIMPELVAIYPILIILVVAHENNKPESVNDMSLSQSIRFASVRAPKSQVYHSESGGESQQQFPTANIDNSDDEVERNEIEVVPRSG